MLCRSSVGLFRRRPALGRDVDATAWRAGHAFVAWGRRAAAMLAAGAVLVAMLAPAAFGQVDPPRRAPDTGLPWLDCAPQPPAPAESCLLRVPPMHLRGALDANATGAEPAEFSFLRPGEAGFPAGVSRSATLLLVDVSPGPRPSRSGTFAREKALLERIASALPPDELVALYAFSDRLERQVGFTTDRSQILRGIAGLELQGDNTRIASNIRDAIDVLAERDDVLLRHVIVLTDGDEEGFPEAEYVSGAADVAARALDAGVTVSTVGAYWRRERATGARIEYVEALSRGTGGAHADIRLYDSASDNQAVVDRFADGFAGAIRNSGLVVPRGQPIEATISVTIREPARGSTVDYVDRPITAAFVPQSPASGEGATDPAEPRAKILGLDPAMFWGLSGGAAALLLGAVALLVVSRRGAEDEGEVSDDMSADAPDLAGAGAVASGPDLLREPPPPSKPAAKPAAFLVREDTGERMPIAGKRAAIGRSGQNAVVLADESISRVHAELHRNRDGGFSVTDMQSLNGTWINDHRISGTRPVEAGDRIRFGKVETKLVLA